MPVPVMGILGCLSSLWELSKHRIAVCVLVRERAIKIRVPVPFILAFALASLCPHLGVEGDFHFLDAIDKIIPHILNRLGELWIAQSWNDLFKHQL